MTDSNPLPPTPTRSHPRWIPGAVATLLTAQLALLWLQGLQLNRQHQDLSGIREDLQLLTDALEQHFSGDSLEQDGFSPAHARRFKQPAYLLVGRQEEKSEAKGEGDAAGREGLKDIETAKASAQKAVTDARKIQSQLSISENARIAEEKAKIKEARTAWEMWALAAGAVVVAALLLRGWLKSRDS